MKRMKAFIISLMITIIGFFISSPAIGAEDIDLKITKLENRVAKKFSKTFCNSTGFGISQEGALKFSLGETAVEFSKKPLIAQVNLENVKDQILNEVSDTCYYFELSKSDLEDLTLTPNT
tara:strand:- start:154 stop:513 length:360 start_codon:yes stop_codon:yes gene_type:complete